MPQRSCGLGAVSALVWAALATAASAQAPPSPPSPLHRAFAAALTNELGRFADENDLGLWVAIVSGTERFVVPLGTSDGGATRAGPRDIVPVGSYAKPWTAVAVLRLVERGLFGLDDPAAPLIDPFLQRTNGTTTARVWGPAFASLTVRDLLHMTTGLARYGDDWVHNYTMNDPTWDLTPNDYIALLSSHGETTITCKCATPAPAPPAPPAAHCDRSTSCCGVAGKRDEHCPDYNSINFLLLGLLYAGQTGATTWDAVDQKVAAVGPRRAQQFPDTEFYRRGECSSYPRTVHFYDWCGNGSSYPGARAGCGARKGGVDMWNTSCLNGWAFGNAGTSALDAATYFYELLQARTLLNATTLAEMRTYGPGIVMDEVPYGLGLWKTFQLSIDGTEAEGVVNMSYPGIADYLVYEGHAGDDYGTISRQGWHAKLNLSFSIVVNRQFGTWPAFGTNVHGVYCHVWRILLDALGHNFAPAFDCPDWPR